jgi:F0F1-type ATP synthase membrane subunit b/b'
MLVAMIFLLVVFFGAMTYVLTKFLRRDVVNATEHLDKQALEYAQKEEAVKKQLEDARRQSLELVANAQKDGQLQRDMIMKQAEQEKSVIIGEAHKRVEEMIKEADNARLALLAELNHKIEDRAMVRAQELLAQVLPESVRRQLHELWVKNLIEASLESVDRLKIPAGTTEVTIVSAFSLSDQQKKALLLKLKEKLGFEVSLKEEADPDLIAGFVVTVGTLHLDGSLAFMIAEEARAHQ